jgi:large-conductance mechanosensitive channel
MMGSEVTFSLPTFLVLILNIVLLGGLILLIIKGVISVKKTLKMTKQNTADIEEIFKLLKKK